MTVKFRPRLTIGRTNGAVESVMFSSMLVFLLAAAAVHGDCVTSVQRSAVFWIQEPANIFTWQDMADKCLDSFNSVLLQSHAGLSDSERELCEHKIVPLGFYRDSDGSMKFQDGSFNDEEDMVPATDLLGVHDEELDEMATGYAALNLVTGRWHLVNSNFTFECALCQVAPVKTIDEFIEDDSLLTYYQATLVAIDQDGCTRDLEIKMDAAIDELPKILPPFGEIVYTHKSQIGLEVRVWVYDGIAWNLELLQNILVLDTFLMSVEDVSYCPAVDMENGEGNTFDCGDLRLGDGCVSAVNEEQGSFTTMSCLINSSIGQTLWHSNAWQMARAPCSSLKQDENDLAFPYRPTLMLEAVAGVVSRNLRADNVLDSEQRNENLRVLSISLEESRVVSCPGVQIAVARVSASKQTPVGLELAWNDDDDDNDDDDNDDDNEESEDVWPYPYVEASLVYEYHHVTVPRPQVSLALSPALIGAAQRVVFMALWPKPDDESVRNYHERSSLTRFLDVSIMVMTSYPNVMMNSNSFVDLTYSRAAGAVDCATWNEDVWDYGACTQLVSLSPHNAACRCNTRHVSFIKGAEVIRIALKTPGIMDEGVGSDREIMHSR